MDYSEELARAKEEFERSWTIYEFLRDNLLEEDPTSELFHTANKQTDRDIRDKISEKTIALRNSVINGEDMERTIEEGSGVWYWTALSCIRNGIRYDELNPHKIIMEGYQKGMSDVVETPLAYIDLNSLKESVARSAKRMLDYLGMVLSEAEVSPVEIAQYNLQKMRQKPYLHHLF